ncbi:DUF3772 domain-containing protein [Poseidonocella sedimentorum]|uniref:Small-conductance mechanosensitive channel n=1 Tax=Poseidonocella sedimentorum TaxID=871652 RepID=A0A1I6DI57_9RHOB|nr:DUF3772 domain-containing protein [Poseidonocella sedimentorum]SFR05123.1 Small-conductance mechanosensitive channel [Poseidonocella sedimentorum]
MSLRDLSRRALFALASALLAVGLLTAALAQQDTSPPDYETYERRASAAEQLLDSDTASNAELEDIRAQIVTWRAQFEAAENTNATRIETLQSQIEALGPAPDTEAGETEPEEIAARRQELLAQLTALETPRVNANTARVRADSLIDGIDREIRARQNEALLEREAMPLNPANWERAFAALRSVAVEIGREVSGNLSAQRLAELETTWPRVFGILAIALILLLRSQRWIARLAHHVQERRQRRGRIALAFLISLGQVFFPVAGAILFVVAFINTGIPGETGTVFLRALIGFLATTFIALWLARSLFPENTQQPAAFSLSDDLRRGARVSFIATGVLAGFSVVLGAFVGLDLVPPATRGVFLLPFYAGLGLLYFRLARYITRSIAENTHAEAETPAPEGEEESDGAGLSRQIPRLLSGFLTLVAVTGPLLAAAGYVNAAQSIMLPTALTLGVLALLAALQRPIRDLYALAANVSMDEARDALIPVLINFGLAVLALPALALIWGVRATELGELFMTFSRGFSIGETQITPGALIKVLLVFLAALTATRLLQLALKSSVLPRTSLEVGAQNAIRSGVGYVGIALAALIAINAGGIDLTALAFILSALSVGIGFGLQNVVQNFVSGIILLIERPISEGDWIEVGGNMGIVKSISVRSTVIETFDKQQLIVPNGDFISGTVTNWTRGSPLGRAVILVGVAYGTDTRKVEEILLEIARGHPDVMSYPEPGVDFMGFGADSLDFRMRAMLYDVHKLVAVKSELHHRITERFAREGIEIPFAQRDLWLRNPETLTRPAPGGAPEPSGAESAPDAPAPAAKSDSKPTAENAANTSANTGGNMGDPEQG